MNSLLSRCAYLCHRFPTGVPPISSSTRTSPSLARARTVKSCATTLTSCSRAACIAGDGDARARVRTSTSAASTSTSALALDEGASTRRTRPASSARTRAARAIDFDINLHRGAGAYICGEETALIESLEGQPGQAAAQAALPRQRRRLYGCPTTVTNVETVAVAPTILRRGAGWFARFRPQEQHRHEALLRSRATSTTRCAVEEEMSIPLQ